jgi:enoyl-CoA hydratase
MVLFGEVLDGEQAARVGLAYRCVDDDELLAVTHQLAAKAADLPKELLTVTKQTLVDQRTVPTHDEAVNREIEPQVWSTRQPWFAERLAALQARIASRKEG